MLQSESYEEVQRWPETRKTIDARHGAQRGARVALSMRPDQTSPELVSNLMRRYSGGFRREALPTYINTPNLAAIANDGAAYEDDSLYGSTVDLHLNVTEPNPRNFQERKNEPNTEERMRPQGRGNPEGSTQHHPVNDQQTQSTVETRAVLRLPASIVTSGTTTSSVHRTLTDL